MDEEHHARRMPEEARGVHERPHVFPRHLTRLQVLAELAGDRAVAVREAVGDQPQPEREHDPAAERQVEDARGLLRLVAALAARACDEGEGEQAEPRVEEPLRERGAALGPALEVVALVVAVEQCLREPPRGVRPEPEPERDEDDRAVPLLGEQPERPFPIRGGTADPERHEHGQDADEARTKHPSRRGRSGPDARSSRCRRGAAASSRSIPWRFLAPPAG